MAAQAPLHYESSAGTTHLQVIESLPTEVVQCLQNARFLHLATCHGPYPHVSLMNYTYLPSSPYSSSPLIIMTTNPSSKKTENLTANPHVSLLVHDWVSHRPPTSSNRRNGSPPPEASRSSLASLLLNLNTSAMSSISATINGDARLVERETEEESYYKERHLENNTFEGDEGGEELRRRISGTGGEGEESNDGGRETYIEGEEVRVVVVEIREGRVSDWKGCVRDWCLKGEGGNGDNDRNRGTDGEMTKGGR